MTHFLLILGFLTLPLQDNMLKITEQDLAGIEIENARVFNGNALWGYINGGADIYLEYGFSDLVAQKVKYENKQYKVDMYKMNDPESAYGIFSVSHSNCEEMLVNESYSCVTSYQVQFVKGCYYISIINENGSKEEQDVCKSFAKILGNKINEESYSLPELFLKEELLSFHANTKLIEGRLGLENGFPIWATQFQGIEGYRLIVMPIELDDSKIYIASIEFIDPNSLMTFAQNIDQDIQIIKSKPTLIKENQLYLKTIEDNKLVYMESEGDLSLIDKYIKILNLE